MIYSIGYEKLSLENVEQIMYEKGINFLVDIRSFPDLQRPDKLDFNKNRLIEVLGNRYCWRGDLLGRKDDTPVNEASLDRLTSMSSTPAETTLMLLCIEDDPESCHRAYDIGARLLKRGIDMIHIHNGQERLTSDYYP